MGLSALETARPRAEKIPVGAWARRLHDRSCSSHSRALRCADSYSFAFQLRSQFTRELNRAGRIAMNANRFSAHLNIAAFDRTHFVFAQHSQHPRGSFFWIPKQCIRPRARNQPTVIEVISISENFARDL
jgi:hypothetical protein